MKRIVGGTTKYRFRLSECILSIISLFLLCSPAAIQAQWEPDVRLTYNDSLSYTSTNYAWCVAATGDTVYVVWYDFRDGNPEIYYKCSFDAGTTWDADTRLTDNDTFSHHASVATSGQKVHVVWWDRRDGNDETYYKRNPTGNVGVETARGRDQEIGIRLLVRPNPFTYFVRIPGHETKRFNLFDIAGRPVGTFSGKRIGENLRPGVYFLKEEGSCSKPLMVVKVK